MAGSVYDKPTAPRIIDCRGGRSLELGRRTLIMGILNITPDSFSDGGRYDSLEAAVARARQMQEEGADILDIGGESTRPGAEPVSLEQELERVVPVIRALRERFKQIPISIDTYKAEVARQALEAGADIVNDVWRLTADPGMAGIVAEYACPVILMHNRRPRPYERLMDDIRADLLESVALAKEAGIDDGRILLDPGIGFAKTYPENLQVMHELERLCDLGYPVLLGTSRKKFIRDTLSLPADEVIEGTAATVALGIAKGCDIVRVHDVRVIARTVRMTDAMVRRPAPFYTETGKGGSSFG